MTRLSSFQRLAIWTTATTYFLILVGGLVRASGAGLGCPDWPRCFGSWIPPSSAADLPPRFDPSRFNPALMWTEYVNRLLGVAVGLLILATAISAWRHHRRQPRILWTTFAAFVLVGFEGWLGGRVVAHELAAWLVTAHLIVAIVIVQLLLYATVEATRKVEDRTLNAEGMVASVLIGITLLQAAVGTQVRGHIEDALIAGVGRDLALGTVGRIDYIHRGLAFAVLTAAALQALWLLSRRFPQASQTRWSLVVLALAVLQIALGLVMAYGSLVPAAQVGHLAIGSLLLGAETMVWLRRQDAATTPAA